MLKEKLNKIPFALKFGFVFAVVVGCLFILLALVETKYFPSHSDMGNLSAWVLILSTLPVVLLSGIFHFPGWLMILLGVIYLFLIGSVIGLLVQFLKYLKNKLGNRISPLA